MHLTEIFESGAYHGSSKDFQEFSVDHIGTGTGRATFGWGIYVTKQKTIANRYKEKRGKIYHLDIPDDSEFLLWEASFDQQSPYVQDVLNRLDYQGLRQKMIDEEQVSGYEKSTYHTDSGEDIYGLITTTVLSPIGSPFNWTEDQKRSSMLLLKAGIAGIKHLDPESGTKTNDHYNYVIFDPRRIKIIKTTKS